MVAYEGNDDDVAELEEIFNGGDPERGFFCAGSLFSLSYKSPEFLPLAEDQPSDKVIFEKDGIPYIDDEACNRNKSAKEDLDGKFAKLVEAVVYNKGRP